MKTEDSSQGLRDKQAQVRAKFLTVKAELTM